MKTYNFEDYGLNTTNNDPIVVVVTDDLNVSTVNDGINGNEPANSTQKQLNFVIKTNDTVAPVISNLTANLKGGAPLICNFRY